MVAIEPSAQLARATGDTLEARFDPRANSLTMIRLLLATTVAVAHAGAVGFGVQFGLGADPHAGMSELGDFAVDAFFVLSGFLVTMSYVRLASLPRYLWHRCVRILPAFWVCLLITALVVAPVIAWLEGREPTSVFPAALGYLTNNAALHMSEFGVAGLPTGTHMPGVVNGALWTLFYEFACYLLVAALGVAGALTRRRVLALLAVTLVWASQIAHTAGIVDLPMPLMRRFLLVFLLGMCAYLYREHLAMRGTWAAAAAVLTIASAMLLPDYRALAAPAFAYVMLWATVALPLRWDPGIDLSYGMYIFHWPIQTVLALAGATALGHLGFAVLTTLLAGLAATVSWFVVEKPALATKGWSPKRPGAGPDRMEASGDLAP